MIYLKKKNMYILFYYCYISFFLVDLWALKKKPCQVILGWGHQQPLKGSRFHHPKKVTLPCQVVDFSSHPNNPDPSIVAILSSPKHPCYTGSFILPLEGPWGFLGHVECFFLSNLRFEILLKCFSLLGSVLRAFESPWCTEPATTARFVPRNSSQWPSKVSPSTVAIL